MSATRDPEAHGIRDLGRYITFGGSPRASINLILTARALAFVRGRDYALPQDVLDMSLDVLRHRMVLSYEALTDDVTERRPAAHDHQPHPQSPWCRCVATAISASAPERVLQRLEWQVIRRLDGLLQGDYRSLFFGYGVDFANLREYQPEDDVRYIDWNVTARMDTPYVRVYQEDREISCWFLLDLSPSLDFGTADAEREKRTVVIDLVTVLARLLTRHGNRVGAMLYGERLDLTIPPRSGRDQVLRLTNALLQAPRLPSAAFTDLAPLLQAGSRGIRRRSLVVLVSDFISAPGWERDLSLLARRHEVLAVRVRDPRETTLPDVGTAGHGGRRDRRAAGHRYPRPGVPRTVRGGRAAARGGPAGGLPASRRGGVPVVDRRGPGPRPRAHGHASLMRRRT